MVYHVTGCDCYVHIHVSDSKTWTNCLVETRRGEEWCYVHVHVCMYVAHALKRVVKQVQGFNR